LYGLRFYTGKVCEEVSHVRPGGTETLRQELFGEAYGTQLLVARPEGEQSILETVEWSGWSVASRRQVDNFVLLLIVRDPTPHAPADSAPHAVPL
jgi:hypothetical protein